LIQSLYIINDSGETLASAKLGDFEMDDALFGGFLSAIQMYSQKMSGKSVEEMSLENYRMLISETDGVSLVTIHDKGDKDAVDLNQRILEVLRNELSITGQIITEESLELIRKAAKQAESGFERAGDWASKML
jgi:hypothetical protein